MYDACMTHNNDYYDDNAGLTPWALIFRSMIQSGYESQILQPAVCIFSQHAVICP